MKNLEAQVKCYLEIQWTSLSEELRESVAALVGWNFRNDSSYVLDGMPTLTQLRNWDSFQNSLAIGYECSLEEVFEEDIAHYPVVKQIWDEHPHLFQTQEIDGLLITICW